MLEGPWTDFENDLIVDKYFEMLAADVGIHPAKAATGARRRRC